jgi:hypothetical protein
MSGEGRALAVWLRDDEDGPWQGVQSPCRRCERTSLDLEDSECPGCRGDAEARYAQEREQRARAIQGLYRATAMLLRREGFPERAEKYERRAR